MHLKTGGMGKTIRIQYSVIQFFFKTLTWIKGLKTRKKGIDYFVMYFLLLYYIIYIYIYRYIDSI